MKTKLFLVANNHIDREWTYDAQLTRMLTVRFFEDLLEAFRKIPDFQFVLDSQAVPLEDFLEIFPDRREILKKHVASRRLWAGPWYTAPDCFYLNGESIVRNLLVGHRVAGSFGNVSKFGYTPFGWGQVSQLPQIYSGFGIDSAFFYRGADTIDDVYYNWKGADGTTVRCIKYHRTNFFDKVFRPVTKAREPVPWDRELIYCGDEVPFMFGDDGHKYEHGFVAGGRYHIRQGAIAGAVEGFLKDEAGAFPGGLVLGMNGMEIVPVWLHLPEQLGIGDFEVVEKSSGNRVDFSISARGEMTDRIFRDPTDTSLYVYGELVRICLEVESGGLGYKTYVVRKAGASRRSARRRIAAKNRMENEFLSVRINCDGTLDVNDKRTRRIFRGLHHFTDTGDNGDSWVRFVPDRNRRYSTKGTKAGIRLLQNDHLAAKFEIVHRFMIPE